MVTLHVLTSAGKDRKRIGRGGGRGGTSGRGHKGQKARTSGTVRPGYEGGQMPLYRRIPKLGFSNAPFKKIVHTVDVSVLEERFEHGQEITRDLLIRERIINVRKGNAANFVKLLGNTEITKKFSIYLDACSQSARGVIEKIGGEVRLTGER